MHITQSQSLLEIITDAQEDKNIIVWPDIEFNYLLILSDDASVNVSINGQANSQSTIKVLCIGQSHHHIHSKIITSLVENNAQADVYILSLLKDHSEVNVHGNITLAANIAKVSWHLSEENLILWDNIKIKTAPILDVRSSDVSASHGCKIERLDPKRLFYMQSRGLTPTESQSLIIDGYLNTLFDGFDWYDTIKEDILKEIKNLQ